MTGDEYGRGDLVIFIPSGEILPRKGEVRSEPMGRHRVYKVRTFNGDTFQVPQVLLTPLSN